MFTALVFTFTVQSFAATPSWTKVADKEYFNGGEGTGQVFIINNSIPNGTVQTWNLPEGFISLRLLNSNGSLISDLITDYGVSPDYERTFEIQVSDGTFMIYFPEAFSAVENLSKGVQYKLEAVVPFEDKVPVLSGQTAFVTNYDDPISESQIRSYISAYDEVDGNITHLIQLVSSTYNPLSTSVGQYEINYSVTDSSGNIATLKVLVLVKDVGAPVMSLGSWSQSISYTKTLDVEALKNSITKTDNFDTPANVTVSILSNSYNANKTKVGSYPIVFEATDKSNNKSTKTYTVNVIDDVKPIASYSETVFKPATSKLTIEDIKNDITATDIIDGNVTASLTVVRDEYTGFGNKVGSYQIEFRVSDSSGNTLNFVMTVKVVDNIPPVFMVTPGQFIRVEDIVTLTHQDFVDILTRTNQINFAPGTTFRMLLNEYENNENVPGIYAISMKFESPTGESLIKSFGVEVLETEFADGVIEDTKTIFNKVIDFVKANPIKSGLILVGALVLIGGIFMVVMSNNSYKPSYQRSNKYSKYRRK